MRVVSDDGSARYSGHGGRVAAREFRVRSLMCQGRIPDQVWQFFGRRGGRDAGEIIAHDEAGCDGAGESAFGSGGLLRVPAGEEGVVVDPADDAAWFRLQEDGAAETGVTVYVAVEGGHED